MAVNVYPGSVQFVALGKETTYGTPAAAPTIFPPLESVPKWDPKITMLKDSGLRGGMFSDVNQIQGNRYEEFSYKSLMFADSLMPHFVNMLGAYVQTGTTAAPTTTLSAGTAAGVTTINTVASIPATSVIQIDTGVLAEIATVNSVTGAGPYTLTLATATRFAHASAVTVTNTAQPYTQSEAILNGLGTTAQPPSYTGWLYLEGGQCVRVPGMMLSDLKLTMKPNEKPTIDASWQGLPGTFVSAPTYTPTALKPFNTNNLTISVGGVATTAASDIEIDFKRDTKMALGFTGTQSPVSIFMGSLTVTGTVQAIYQGVTDQFLTDLLANTQPSISASIYADGDSTHPFTVQLSKVALNSATVTGSMTSYVTINAPFNALANTTDAIDGALSPAQVKLASAASTVY